MRIIASLLAALAVASPALAAQPVQLKTQTVDADGIITLGDLFDGAGAAGATAIARRVGPSAVLDAAAIQAIALRAGLDWANPDGIRRIVVSEGRPAAAPAERANRDVLTYARTLAAGDIVEAADVVWSKAATAPAGAPTDPDAVIGMAARRPVRAGQAVSTRDVQTPIVIKAGDLVTVTYEAVGISLSLQAKAITPGGVGGTISIQNPTSQKIVQAVVVGPGQALVGPQAQTVRLAAR